MTEQASEKPSKYAGRDFYEVFGVPSNAPLRDIQRSYRVLALREHPDRNGNSRESTRDFQQLSRMMEILADPNKRASYDALGDPESSSSSSTSYDTNWRAVFQRVTEADIDAYAAHYIGSQEEIDDVVHAYNQFCGNFKSMLEWIPLSDPKYLSRYRKIIDKAIEQKQTKLYKAWENATQSAAQYQSKYDDEAQEAKTLLDQTIAKYKPFLPPPTPPTSAIQRLPTLQAANEIPETKISQNLKSRPKHHHRQHYANDGRDDGAEDGKDMVVCEGEGLLGVSLAVGMRAREIARHREMVRSLEERYGKRRRPESLPSEEEFMHIQRRLERNKQQSTRRKNKRTRH